MVRVLGLVIGASDSRFDEIATYLPRAGFVISVIFYVPSEIIRNLRLETVVNFFSRRPRKKSNL